MFRNHIFEWLDNALDYGISENEFWDMTLAELNRSVNSRQRIRLNEARERAQRDYILADLIGRSIGRIYSDSNDYPSIEEVYPSLFDAKELREQKQQQIDELSVMRFKQFAEAHNKNFKGGT